MKSCRHFKFFATVSLSVLLLCGTSFAALENSTIPDTYTGNYTPGFEPAGENNEIDGGSPGQQFDLEAAYYDLTSSDLRIVGGTDFINGGGGFATGDILIDINNDAKFGQAYVDDVNNALTTETETSNSYFKWDYAISFDRIDPGTGLETSSRTGLAGEEILTGDYGATPDTYGTPGTYKVYKLGDSAVFSNGAGAANNNYEQNPYAYVSGGMEVATGLVDFARYDGSSPTGYQELPFWADLGNIVGGPADPNHAPDTFFYTDYEWYEMKLNLGWLSDALAEGPGFDGFFLGTITTGCINDLVAFQVVPEPSTVLLLGLGLIGLANVSRRRGRVQ
jgi:hypothetical protein